MEIRLAVPPSAGRRRVVRSVSRPKTLHRRPGFDQRAIDREMIRAKQALHPRLRHHRAQQLGGDIALQQPLAVLGKCRVIPGSIVNAHADEPAKQEIELQPLHQLPLRADRVEHLQQHRPQQLLGRNRGATHQRVERRKLARKRRQGLVDHTANGSQRMILANPRFEIDVTEQRPRPLSSPRIRPPPPKRKTKESHHDSAGQRLFQRPASGLRPGQQQSHAFASRATTSCALAAPVARRVTLLRPRSGGSRIGLPPGLHYGRRCSALLTVLDLRYVWLSAFSIVILPQARLRAGAWWGGRLGRNDAPSSSGPLPKPAPGWTGPSVR